MKSLTSRSSGGHLPPPMNKGEPVVMREARKGDLINVFKSAIDSLFKRSIPAYKIWEDVQVLQAIEPWWPENIRKAGFHDITHQDMLRAVDACYSYYDKRDVLYIFDADTKKGEGPRFSVEDDASSEKWAVIEEKTGRVILQLTRSHN